MSTFNNVTVVRKANIYFDGGVTSRTLEFDDGSTKTLGVIQPGEYAFDTGKKEIMDIQAGTVEVLLPGSEQWQSFGAGDTFEVPANAHFRIRSNGVADYCCSFVD